MTRSGMFASKTDIAPQSQAANWRPQTQYDP